MMQREIQRHYTSTRYVEPKLTPGRRITSTCTRHPKHCSVVPLANAVGSYKPAEFGPRQARTEIPLATISFFAVVDLSLSAFDAVTFDKA